MVKPPEESAFSHPSYLDIDIAEQTADLIKSAWPPSDRNFLQFKLKNIQINSW